MAALPIRAAVPNGQPEQDEVVAGPSSNGQAGQNVAGFVPLKFAPFSSDIELSWYAHYFSSKLEHDKLNESARQIFGIYEPQPGAHRDDSMKMQLMGKHYTNADRIGSTSVRADGFIRNTNTLDAFKNIDRNEILKNDVRQIWDAIKDGTIYSVPSLLSSFSILSYADLKKYRMTYWFCFPALHSDPVWKRSGNIGHLTVNETERLESKIGTYRLATKDSRQNGFFLAKKILSEIDQSPDWAIGTLGKFERGFFDDVPEKDRYVAFVDPSTYDEHPGWPLRNLLVLIRQRFHVTKVQILCYRDTHERRHEARSIILPLVMDPVESIETIDMPKATGWERNIHGKMGSRSVSLAESMDPLRIADQSVDLNLKLMKWRVAPKLELDKIKGTKCLLLGAGTLGSYVSRCLMAWGVRKITLVDSGVVSFSNPVRQPLFGFTDCLNGGAPKAIRAAEALKEVYPGVDSKGHVIEVPMLGHPIKDKTEEDFEKLKALIEEHDAIFLLMDSRESRWLPTVMAKAAGKIVINAALGFDTFVVIRHGPEPKNEGETTLGCYFCNDIVAPGNSQKNLTLDQQCTVTRPGVAPMASAQAVELLMCVLDHPLGVYAPAPQPSDGSGSSYERDPPDHSLGLVPHQIRGFLAEFHQMKIRGESYPHCSACSAPILSAYKSNGWEFLKQALEDKDYVSELSGLAEVQRQAQALEDDFNWDEDGVEDGDEEAVMI